MADAEFTAARLRELLHYEPRTGKFTKRGKPVGFITGMGYEYLYLDKKSRLAHRMAWLYVYGELPKHQIDHINGVRTDNRISNLRDVVPRVNNENKVKVRCDNKSSGMTGVSWHVHSAKWRARIWQRGVEYRLGLFDTPEGASDAYTEAKRRLHEGCTI